MSPRGITSIVVWVSGLALLFAALFLWGDAVEKRDRARKLSTVPVLQRGDLPSDLHITRESPDEHSIFSGIIASTGAEEFALISVNRQHHPVFTSQVLYVRYHSAEWAAQATTSWRTLLEAPETSGDGPTISTPAGDYVTAVWQREAVVIVIRANGANDAVPIAETIANAADARLDRWLAHPIKTRTLKD